MMNTLLAQVSQGLDEAADAGRTEGFIEGYRAGAWAMREFIMGDSTTNPYDTAREMEENGIYVSER